MSKKKLFFVLLVVVILAVGLVLFFNSAAHRNSNKEAPNISIAYNLSSVTGPGGKIIGNSVDMNNQTLTIVPPVQLDILAETYKVSGCLYYYPNGEPSGHAMSPVFASYTLNDQITSLNKPQTLIYKLECKSGNGQITNQSILTVNIVPPSSGNSPTK